MIHDLRLMLRVFAGRHRRPSAAILDSRTLRSTPESGRRAGWDGAKRKRGSKLHLAVNTLGHLLTAPVTPAAAQDRVQVERLAAAVQAATGKRVEVAYVDQGYTGDKPAEKAHAHELRQGLGVACDTSNPTNRFIASTRASCRQCHRSRAGLR